MLPNVYEYFSGNETLPGFGVSGLKRERPAPEEVEKPPSYSGEGKAGDVGASFSELQGLGQKNMSDLLDKFGSFNPGYTKDMLEATREDRDVDWWNKARGNVTDMNYERANLLAQEDGATTRAYINSMPKWI